MTHLPWFLSCALSSELPGSLRMPTLATSPKASRRGPCWERLYRAARRSPSRSAPGLLLLSREQHVPATLSSKSLFFFRAGPPAAAEQVSHVKVGDARVLDIHQQGSSLTSLTFQAQQLKLCVTSPTGASTSLGLPVTCRRMWTLVCCAHIVCAFTGTANNQIKTIEWNDEVLYADINGLKN